MNLQLHCYSRNTDHSRSRSGIYDNRKDSLVRDELEQQQDRMDALIATQVDGLPRFGKQKEFS